MQSTEPSVASIVHYGQSVMDNEENPPVLGGASMQPSSPQKKDDNLPLALNDVGIPTSKPSQKIKNIDVTSYEEGYDSDGDMRPFYDAIAGEKK